MAVPAFDPKEMTVVGEMAPRFGMGQPIPIYDYPVTRKEAFFAMTKREPIWQITGVESKLFAPALLPDNISRAMVLQEEPFDNQTEGGGKDMFGLEWEYIAQVGGSMIRPGKPFLDDANDWNQKVVWPEIDSWDWEGSAQRNNDTYLDTDCYNNCWLQTGFFERLISMMDFEGAIMAMVDEDQKGAVKDFFDKLSDLYIRIFDKFITYFPKIDGFCLHDDWGSQKETFFSPSVVEEMIVPFMKKVTDFLHAKGKGAELHSCGQILKQVPNMIKAGWDYWGGQAMNDTHAIYDLYGGKIVVGVIPDKIDLEAMSEDEQRAAARSYADRFCAPGKPSFLNSYSGMILTPSYREELYMRSRQNYSRT